VKTILITTSSFGQDDKSLLEMMKAAGFEYVLNPHKRKLNEDELIELLLKYKPQCIIAGTETYNNCVLDIAKPFLKIISRCGTGLDSVDCKYAEKTGISIKNTPNAPTKAVAELTIGLMLDILRRISATDKNIRNGKFDKFMGSLLFEKTVGVIGYGRIGKQLAYYAEAFGCKIIYNDPSNSNSISLDCLLRESDIVTLHCPLISETKNIINAEALSKMKKTAILLNVSRGGLIDENALIRALENKQIAGAGIDCFEKEPYSGELITFDNVVLTSHIGSYAKEARIEQELDAVKNILENMQ
jgi:D-3-phosphoglycerate dehydrogenase